MFPLRDHNPTEILPLFTVLIGAVTVAAWVLVQGAGAQEPLVASICALGVVPADISGAPGGVQRFCAQPGIGAPALVTSIFLHGGWGHLIGNLWFLWVFGNNIEDSMGHLRFVAFYLLTGVAAAAAQIALEPSSPVPMVGASGAISGIMGAYVLLYPRARIDTLVGFWIVPLPAWVMLGYWFLLQTSGVFVAGTVGGGVAYGAHVGGFVAGLVLVGLFRNERLVTAKRGGVVLGRDELDHGGWW
jgi:membrane associated rhomboid family serine protease